MEVIIEIPEFVQGFDGERFSLRAQEFKIFRRLGLDDWTQIMNELLADSFQQDQPGRVDC